MISYIFKLFSKVFIKVFAVNICVYSILLFPNINFSQSFPSYTINVLDSTSKGYYFITPAKIGFTNTAKNPIHMILDENGNVVYFNKFDIANTTNDFKLHKNGLMSYSFKGNRFYIMDSTFQIIDSLRCKNGVTTDTHDMLILPNGHYLMLGVEDITMDLSSYKVFKNNGVAGSKTAIVKSGVIQELDPTKTVVFEWHAKDYFNFLEVDTTRLTSPTNVDWTHCNAIDLDKDGNILLSSRHFNEITKINRSTGNIMWRLGGHANQFNFTNDKSRFIGQHDIRRIDNGHITLLDNGQRGTLIHPVAAKEYDLDELNLTATLVWSYVNDSNQYSQATGNVQRLGNGNTLVNYGFVAGLGAMFDVIKPDGKKVFEISFNDTLSTYRAFNYEDLPWTLNRPTINCKSANVQYYLEADSGYDKYLWSTGDTTQSIELKQTGFYQVFVKKGTSGLIGSAPINIRDINNPCGGLSIKKEIFINSTLIIFPNPVIDKIILANPLPIGTFKIMDAIGTTLAVGETNKLNDFNCYFLKGGLYFLVINGDNLHQIIKFLKE